MTNASTADERMQTYKKQSRNQQELDYAASLGVFFENSQGTIQEKLENFQRYTPRQQMSQFLAKHQLFQHVLHVHGHIIECGVYFGGGLMSWAQFSAVYEPFNNVRRVVGFDTFAGFPSIAPEDDSIQAAKQENLAKVVGGYATGSYADLQESIRLFDMNRPLGHIPRVELVAGDAMLTIPEYVERNPHLVVAMLYLDFDLYGPTKMALEHFVPRMPKGAVLAFDELALEAWPGETVAVQEVVGLRNLRIQRFPFTSTMSYAILE